MSRANSMYIFQQVIFILFFTSQATCCITSHTELGLCLDCSQCSPGEGHTALQRDIGICLPS
jgi:hypothetical protein